MIRLLLLLLTLLLTNHSQAQDEDEKIKLKLDSLAHEYMNGIIKHKGRKAIHNVQMSLIFKDKYVFHGAAGLVKKNGSNLTADHKFKIASVTKTFTSTIILQLMEEGKLKLTDSLPQYFDKELVDKLLIIDGESFGNRITIKQLLSHKSGLKDYIFEDWKFLLAQLIKPGRAWTPETLLENYFKHNLNKKSKLKPGEAFHYSDTNYLLLGLIIEQLCNTSLAEQYQVRIAVPLGLKDTYLDPYDLDTTGMMHQYRKRRNVTEKLNASMDWAGGGLISTTKDLANFIQSLLENKLFQHTSTLDLMVTCDSLDETAYGYNFGIERQDFPISDYLEGATDTMTIFGHSGYWSVNMYAFPEEDITLVMSIGQVYDDKKDYNPLGKLISACFAAFEEKEKLESK
jgi:D-alanyl-D-alanine carboxypeptidase